MAKKLRRKVYENDCGMCLTTEQLLQDEDVKMAYLLKEDGTLFIVGNDWLLGVEDQHKGQDKESPDDHPQLVSQFKDMDFHTAVIWPGVKGLGEGCFNECKKLTKIIIHNRGLFIHTHCAEGSSLSSISQKNLKDAFGLASHPETPLSLNHDFNLSIDEDEE